MFQNIVHFSPYSPSLKKSTMNEEEVVSGEVEAPADHMDVSTYLARIGFEEKVKTSLECLARLQAAHQHAVPYENLDVFLGHKKVLKVAELYKKMVVEGRGGWCCELNGLFCWLLQEVGFMVRMVSASYYIEEKQKFKEEFDHLALIVTISEQVEIEHVSKSHHYLPLWKWDVATTTITTTAITITTITTITIVIIMCRSTLLTWAGARPTNLSRRSG